MAASNVIAETTVEPLKPIINVNSVTNGKSLINGTNRSFHTKHESLPDGIGQLGERPAALVTVQGKSKKHIRWVPLRIPITRRMEMGVVVFFGVTGLIFLSIFWFLCAIPLTWPIIIPYLIYLALAEVPHDAPPSNILTPIIRSPKFWSNFTNYFPMTLHRSVALSPNENYLFGFHPHGIISHGAWGNFVTKTTGWYELFPGISNTVLTLESNFRLPFYREYLVAMGLGSVSRKSCEGLLGGVPGEVSEAEVHKTIWDSAPKFFRRRRPRTKEDVRHVQSIASGKKIEKKTVEGESKPKMKRGQGITIVVGGAQESLFARPGTLTLKMRKGFLRVAVRTGAYLVPVLSFGENDLFDQYTPDERSFIHKSQIMIKRIFGFTIPLFHARGIFNYDVGLVPYRTPVNTVVGRPIPTVQTPDPRDDYIDELFELYCQELERLWTEYKDRFLPNRIGEMQIIK